MTHTDQPPPAITPSRYRGFRSNSAYQSTRASVIRQQLFELLGPRCAECGCDLHGIAWQVNHIWQRAWQPNKLCYYRRNLRYLAEALAGDVNLLCPDCNRRYRPLPRSAKLACSPTTDQPF